MISRERVEAVIDRIRPVIQADGVTSNWSTCSTTKPRSA